jgi:GT2 family glycosyltransferase
MSEPRRLNIHVGIVVYNLAQEAENLIASCVSKVGHSVTVQLFNHSPGITDRQRAVWRVCEKAARGEIIGNDGNPVRCVVHDHRKNRGLVVGWNEAMLAAYVRDYQPGTEGRVTIAGNVFNGVTSANLRALSDDTDTVCILVNDDVVFDAAPAEARAEDFLNDWDRDARLPWLADDGKSDVDRIAEIAATHREHYGWTILGYNSHYRDRQPWRGIGWSCLALNPILLRTVGIGDENIVPVYLEDCDWGNRAHLAGLSLNELKQTRVVHLGSLHHQVCEKANFQNTNPASPAHQALHAYYSRKWGGLPGSHAYTVPFNDPNLSLFIGPEHKERPYGPLYDRYGIAGEVTV